MRLDNFRGWLVLLLLFLPWASSAQTSAAISPPPQFRSQDHAISAIYVEQSSVAFAAKDWSTVSNLLHTALEFNPNNSDALYLRGEMYQQVGGKIPEVISSYRAAIDAQSWHKYSENECRLKLAPLLLRTKQYAAALHLLRGMGNVGADNLYYTAASLVGLKRDLQARILLAQASGAFPSDTRFPVLRLRIDAAYRQALADRFLAEPATSSIPQKVLESLITYSRDPARKQKLVALYGGRFPFSPTVFAQSLLASKTVTPPEIDRYVSNGLLADGRLTKEVYSSLPSGSAKTLLASKIAAYTGKVRLDTNDDGIPEETAEYSQGELTRLVVDFDEDGVPEYDIAFSGGIPKTLTLRQNGHIYSLTYGSYPFLESAALRAGDHETTYTLEPERVSFPLFGSTSTIPTGAGAFPPLVHSTGSISRESLFVFALQVQTTNPKTKVPVSLWKRNIGNILELERLWQDGRYDYRAVFHGGQKFSAEIDVDNDGFYEVHERYRLGKLWKLSYYPSDTTAPEFTLVLDPYPILSWDFNQDGLIDEVEKRVSPHTTILEFSTKMNGVFDVVTKEVTK